MLLGIGKNGNYVASDASALLQATRDIIYLEEGDVAELRNDDYRIVNCLHNQFRETVKRIIHKSHMSVEAISLGSSAHFMQKEIFEQPSAVANTLEMISNAQSISPDLFGSEAEKPFLATNRI